MNNNKYVVVSHTGIEVPILLPELLCHDVVSQNTSYKVVSAGFCYVNKDGTVKVWGKSVSLKVSSRPKDAQLIQDLINFLPVNPFFALSQD